MDTVDGKDTAKKHNLQHQISRVGPSCLRSDFQPYGCTETGEIPERKINSQVLVLERSLSVGPFGRLTRHADLPTVQAVSAVCARARLCAYVRPDVFVL